MKTRKTKPTLSVGSSDLFAFVGVRKIIGDPTGRLMQDEVADRIRKLVEVLKQTVGVMDSMAVMKGLPGLTPTERKVMDLWQGELTNAVTKAMPEWDDVLAAVHKANTTMSQRRD